MTRAFYQTIHCPHCGQVITMETEFSRWVRNHPELDSKQGFAVTDQDVFWHQFRTERGRDFQLMMHIEIKTCGAKPTTSQQDTLGMVNQMTRNRRETPTKECYNQSGNAPRQALSLMTGRWIWLRHYGVHLLRFSGLGPTDSATIWWDSSEIDKPTLVSILRFDLDPDTLKPMDFRSHHKQRFLPLFA